MSANDTEPRVIGKVDASFSEAERVEMRRLGILDDEGNILQLPRKPAQVPREPITSLDALNEAYCYGLPSSFTRGLSVKLEEGQTILYISGTASIDDKGDTVCLGDLRAQCWRTYWNITRLLESRGASWHDIVRTTCYLRDIERDYDEFNKVRTLFFECVDLDPLPASTGIQARLCRSDLLVEIEAFAFVKA
jgi:enamine deaminase RidA (YjgF/YER057c/UK114 family)